MRLCELKGKTVINDTDCCILGFVVDIDFDRHQAAYWHSLSPVPPDYADCLEEILNM